MADDDPHRWLKDVAGEAALTWVREHNAETFAELTQSACGVSELGHRR
ncbi:hypothetical protein Franean1_3996 [Parafrankia sp. EAN1pec]|nr:hypothetical protein Franean1_3996 [Frankia sp. EAN1pec]